MNVKKVIVILFSIVAIYFLVFSPHGLVKMVQLKLQIWRIQEEIKILQAKEVMLEHETRLLQSDTAYIHRAAWEKFGIR